MRNLSAADAHATVSGKAADVLRGRFGVEATVAPNAVDCIFAPRAARTAAPIRTCCSSAGTAARTGAWPKCVGIGRPYAMTVASSTSSRVTASALEPAGQVVVSPDRPTLSALYRGAAVASAARTIGRSHSCLEAMASGTPVVSTRNTGIQEYARDGMNALLADVRDVAGLVAQVRRVLDEPGLAARLRAGGLATTPTYFWDATVDRQKTSTARNRGPVASTVGGDWRFDLGGLRFVDPDDEERLRRRAAATSAALPGHTGRVPRFSRAPRRPVAGRRAETARRSRHGTRLPAGTCRLPQGIPYAAAPCGSSARGRFDAALPKFLSAYRQGNPAVRTCAARWIALTLPRTRPRR